MSSSKQLPISGAFKKERKPDLPTNHWYTKPEIVELVRESFGGVIGLDPFADPTKRIKTEHGHFTYEDNGLLDAWGFGRETDTVFINPGYSHGESQAAIQKVIEQKNKGNIVGCIGLFKIGILSNKGTQDLIQKNAASVCIWKGRMDFDPGEPLLRWREQQRKLGKKIPEKIGSNNFDICWVNFFKENSGNFDAVFKKYGMVLEINN